MVYVLNSNGQPLMPTGRHGKAKHLLRDGKAVVVKRCPFTIKLLYDGTNYAQPVSLGMDAGSKIIGVSATTEKKVLYEADVELRNDITDLLSARRQHRKSRRNRKTRYRKARFLNRTHSKKEGWLAPSVRQKVDTHLTVVDKVCRMLPVTDITVETASFDIQKIKNPDISGVDYQKGEQLGFANLREYCFWLDNYTCRWCRGKSKNKILHMHHWNYWRGDHSNKPSSVVTLCDVCNDSKNHKPDGFLWGWEPKITRSYKAPAFMGIMRWAFYSELKDRYSAAGIPVSMTYGYITKNTRIESGLPKEHYIDARCISGHPNAEPSGEVFYQKKVRCHNRQIHKSTILKGGIRKRNQAPYKVKGFRLYDAVSAKNSVWYIHGRRTQGSFVLKTLDGQKLEIAPTKLKFIGTQNSFITERRRLIA